MNWPQEFSVFVCFWWDFLMKSYTQQEKTLWQQTLSRVPECSPVKEHWHQETETDMVVRSIIENISVSDKWPEEIRQKQITDSIDRQVMNYDKRDYAAARKDLKLKPYWFLRQYTKGSYYIRVNLPFLWTFKMTYWIVYMKGTRV